LAKTYVQNVANGTDVKTNHFLAAITAYTLSLMAPNDPPTKAKVLELIQNIVGKLTLIILYSTSQLIGQNPELLLSARHTVSTVKGR
jgi:hypothetical protein